MAIGIKSVAYHVPSQIRSNSYWHEHHPQLVADAERHNLAKLWKRREAAAPNRFDRVMDPYLCDPFRGAVERRILAEHETGLSLEVAAARERQFTPNQWKAP